MVERERISQIVDKSVAESEKEVEKDKSERDAKEREKDNRKMINAIDKFQVAGPASQNTRITECASINRFAVDSVT